MTQQSESESPSAHAARKRVTLVGNSQLITSVLAAYGSAAQQQQAGEDWRNRRLTSGSLICGAAQPVNFVSCGKDLFEPIEFEQERVVCGDTLAKVASDVGQTASAVVLMVRGHEFAALSLVDDGRWDFAYAGRPIEPGRQVVPLRDVQAHLRRATRRLVATCIVFASRAPARAVFYVPAPPPIESAEHIRANPESFGALIDRFGLRPSALRQKLYDCMHELLAQELADHGVVLMPAPAEALTPAGGLRADHAHGCLHGNHLYGQALVRQLIAEGICAPV